jgi:hypothetical protein
MLLGDLGLEQLTEDLLGAVATLATAGCSRRQYPLLIVDAH